MNCLPKTTFYEAIDHAVHFERSMLQEINDHRNSKRRYKKMDNIESNDSDEEDCRNVTKIYHDEFKNSHKQIKDKIRSLTDKLCVLEDSKANVSVKSRCNGN